jgi:hypothetical protein
MFAIFILNSGHMSYCHHVASLLFSSVSLLHFKLPRNHVVHWKQTWQKCIYDGHPIILHVQRVFIMFVVSKKRILC